MGAGASTQQQKPGKSAEKLREEVASKPADEEVASKPVDEEVASKPADEEATSKPADEEAAPKPVDKEPADWKLPTPFDKVGDADLGKCKDDIATHLVAKASHTSKAANAHAMSLLAKLRRRIDGIA